MGGLAQSVDLPSCYEAASLTPGMDHYGVLHDAKKLPAK